MFYWAAQNTKFSVQKWRFDKTDPHCSFALLKSNVFLLMSCKLKTNFFARSQLLYMECPLTRKHQQTKNPIFIFESIHFRLRECVKTEFDWEVKQGFEKASVSRAVRL